jgi:hypothetical protein
MGLENVAEVSRVITNPLITVLQNILDFVPGLILGIIIAALGYAVAKGLGILVKLGLRRVGLDDWIEKIGKQDALGQMSASYILGGMVKWYVFALFLIPAISLFELEGVSQLLERIVLFIPELIIACLIVLGGVVLADLAVDKLSHVKKIKWIHVLEPIIKFVIILFFIDSALRHIGVEIVLAQNMILVLFTGIVLALSIALGISFGFASKPIANDIVKQARKRMK